MSSNRNYVLIASLLIVSLIFFSCKVFNKNSGESMYDNLSWEPVVNAENMNIKKSDPNQMFDSINDPKNKINDEDSQENKLYPIPKDEIIRLGIKDTLLIFNSAGKPALNTGYYPYLTEYSIDTVIVPKIYDNIGNFINGLAPVAIYDKWGFIDLKGNVIAPIIYEQVSAFSDDKAAVKLNGKFGYINNYGWEIIPCQYDEAHPFTDGHAQVSLNDEKLWINGLGEVVPYSKPQIFVPYYLTRREKAIREIKKGMVFIEGGSFLMGCDDPDDKKCNRNARPAHIETVEDFYISKYEITQSQWEAITYHNKSDHKYCKECPVENVSWIEVQMFIDTLNKYTGEKFRLPTEAEWEYAARGGKDYLYSGSDSIYKVAWYFQKGDTLSHQVGLKMPNDYGLYDMSGNVWEWTSSFANQTLIFRFREKGRYPPMIIRGGSFGISDYFCLVTSRAPEQAENNDKFLGFRLCR